MLLTDTTWQTEACLTSPVQSENADTVKTRRGRVWLAIGVGVPVGALWVVGLVVMFGGFIRN